jgi:hypothetical protein
MLFCQVSSKGFFRERIDRKVEQSVIKCNESKAVRSLQIWEEIENSAENIGKAVPE